MSLEAVRIPREFSTSIIRNVVSEICLKNKFGCCNTSNEMIQHDEPTPALGTRRLPGEDLKAMFIRICSEDITKYAHRPEDKFLSVIIALLMLLQLKQRN